MPDTFKKLINNDLYQVFICECPASVPVNFASHTWLVCNKKGEVSRYEVLFRENEIDNTLGHLFLNFFPAFSGINVFVYINRWRWKAKLVGYIEGDENSQAKRMIDFIESSKITYPQIKKYNLLGPNSNTYTQWVLDHFKEITFKLPKNAIGRGFSISPPQPPLRTYGQRGRDK